MSINLKSLRGFTLVELLVVVAILAILSIIGTVYYRNIISRARDSARKADIYEISTALEVNKTSDGYIPLQSEQFSSFQWADPLGNVYCIATGTPDDPVGDFEMGDSCPAGFLAVAPGVPEGNFDSWKVCTFLENSPEEQTNIFCRRSGQ